MGEKAIRVAGLGKEYQIGAREQGPTTFREAVANALLAPFRRLGRLSGRSNPAERFWALRDVSFDVEPGEVVGIIGRNGAGKSTLLKVLSQITEPTTGEVELNGRVASLLEVGTGFHPELTGRENVYLNGSILGMSRAEIRGKFDEIVAFAEVEKFLDTPVKRYSSGMYVRLAFAVAAHLEPEILIVDEVLAVGDTAFQKKCLGKMGEVARGGRTVLFVSHNMAAVRTLCSQVAVLERGRVGFVGDVNEGLLHYLGRSSERSDHWVRQAEPAGVGLVFEEVKVDLNGKQPRQTLTVELRLRKVAPHRPAFMALDIADEVGTVVMQALPRCSGYLSPDNWEHLVEVRIELPPMVPGSYTITPWVGPHNTETYDTVEAAVRFTVGESPTSDRTFPHTRDHGCIVPPSTVARIPHDEWRATNRSSRVLM